MVHEESSAASVATQSPTPVVVGEKKVSMAKHEKALHQQYEQMCKEVRSQLGEQLRAIAERMESQLALMNELEDFIRRMGDTEMESGKAMEKLAKSVIAKQKTERNKRESWSQHALCGVWQEMVDAYLSQARMKQALATLYTKKIATSIAVRADDLQKLNKRVRDIAQMAHAEMNRVMNELHTAMKTYHISFAHTSAAEKKVRAAEEELKKVEVASAGKATMSRKQKSQMKVVAKRREKFHGEMMRSTRARNEYILCVRAANAALHKFYADDLSSLMDGADLGMDYWVQSLIDTMCDARKEIAMKEMNALADLDGLKQSIDSRTDKQAFFQSRHNVFVLPKPFDFKAQLGDNEREVNAIGDIAMELQHRQKQIEKRMEGLRFESTEVWKALEASERQIQAFYSCEEEDTGKWRNDLSVTFQYYLKKLEYFILNGNLIERLETRAKLIGGALGESTSAVTPLSDNTRTKRRTRRIAPALSNGKPTPKLFGSSLEEYCELTREEIPLIVTSSVAFLSRYALRHQGLFRVSGSASEINVFKHAFEKGEDVVSTLADGSEANSVAGVLKLYLRELREPPFPMYLFDQFTDCVMSNDQDDCIFISRVRELIVRLPPSSIRLLRFLFAFLSHLCEFSDENMMEPHNVAICLGPTLLPIPEGKDQVFYHNFVNSFIRGLIVHQDAVFPSTVELPGLVYDKFLYAHEEMEEEGVEGEETMDEEDNRRSVLDCTGREGREALHINLPIPSRCSTDSYALPPEDSPHARFSNKNEDGRRMEYSSEEGPSREGLIHSPLLQTISTRRSSLASNGRPAESSNVMRIPLPGMTAEDGSAIELRVETRSEREERVGREEPTTPPSTLHQYRHLVGEASSSGSNGSNGVSGQTIPPPPIYTSLRGQLHHMRKEENKVQLSPREKRGVGSADGESPVSLPRPLSTSNSDNIPSEESRKEVKRLFTPSVSVEQPDVVRESVRAPVLVPLPSPLSASPSPPRDGQRPPLSPGCRIDELNAMLATLKSD